MFFTKFYSDILQNFHSMILLLSVASLLFVFAFSPSMPKFDDEWFVNCFLRTRRILKNTNNRIRSLSVFGHISKDTEIIQRKECSAYSLFMTIMWTVWSKYFNKNTLKAIKKPKNTGIRVKRPWQRTSRKTDINKK